MAKISKKWRKALIKRQGYLRAGIINWTEEDWGYCWLYCSLQQKSWRKKRSGKMSRDWSIFMASREALQNKFAHRSSWKKVSMVKLKTIFVWYIWPVWNCRLISHTKVIDLRMKSGIEQVTSHLEQETDHSDQLFRRPNVPDKDHKGSKCKGLLSHILRRT